MTTQLGLRILHVIRTLDPSWGGPSQGVKHITSQALLRNHRPEIIALDDDTSGWLADYGVTVHALGAQEQIYGFSKILDRWLSANLSRFDRVIVHGVWHYHSYSVWKATRKLQVPYYLFTHGYLDPWFEKTYPLKHLKKVVYWRAIEHKTLRDAKAVLFTSEEEKLLADGSFHPYQCNPRVVGYGAPPPPAPESSKSDIISQLTVKHKNLRGRNFILFLGRIHEKKGIDLLLSAFHAAKEALPGMALLIAGQGEPNLLAQLAAQTKSLGLENDVVWCGAIYGNLKWSILRAADVYILPSHQENFGISVAEALSSGTPVLISNKVNIWREIESANAGLIAPDDIPGTISLLKRWGALPADDRQRMRRNASLCFENYFNITKTSDQFFNILSES